MHVFSVFRRFTTHALERASRQTSVSRQGSWDASHLYDNNEMNNSDVRSSLVCDESYYYFYEWLLCSSIIHDENALWAVIFLRWPISCCTFQRAALTYTPIYVLWFCNTFWDISLVTFVRSSQSLAWVCWALEHQCWAAVLEIQRNVPVAVATKLPSVATSL